MNPACLIVIDTFLTSVLAVSAVTKLRDSEAVLDALTSLRFPAALRVRWFATVIPFVEIVLAFGLLFTPARVSWLPALGVLALFVAYLIVIGWGLHLKPRPQCGCFGKLGNSTVSGATLLRNAILVALAVYSYAAHAGGLGFFRSLRDGNWQVLVAVLAVCIVWRLIVRPTRIEPANTQDVEEDYVRVKTPPGTLLKPSGLPVSLTQLTQSSATLAIFSTCMCGGTVRCVESLDEWQKLNPEILTIMVYSGSHNPREAPYFYDHQSELYNALNLHDKLAGVLFGTDGKLAGGPVYGYNDIAALTAQIRDQLDEAASSGAQLVDND